MACENCFNGCADITSDKCVKYTGIPIPGLGINTGDNLFFVEQQITSKIIELMDGSGVFPIIDPTIVCEGVNQFMTVGTPPYDLNYVIDVLIKSICELDTRFMALKDRVIVVEDAVTALNADYIIGCLEGVTASSDTHDILQAVITKLCAVSDSLALYVPLDQLNDLIGAYLADHISADLMSNRMVPWVAVPFFDPNALSYFSASGAGLPNTTWANIYLCNGQNNTPDMRGRAVVGVTGMAGNPSTDPNTTPGGDNPNYNLNDTAGTNTVTLNNSQLPSHTHSADAVSTDSGHTHSVNMGIEIVGSNAQQNASSSVNNSARPRTTTTGVANIITTVAIGPSPGQGLSHPNIQPVRAAYWIMYIPA